MKALEHLDAIITKLQTIHGLTRGINTGASAAGIPDNRDLGDALATLMLQDNSTTQKLAIRITQLAQKYPNRGA